MLTKELRQERMRRRDLHPNSEFHACSGNVTIAGLPLLESVGEEAFKMVKDPLAVRGECPALHHVEHDAFSCAVDFFLG